MNLGNEIKRDSCPQKYCAKSSVIKDSIPTIIALVIVAFFSGSLFNGSGMDIAVTIIIEVLFVVLMYGFVFLMFGNMKKRLAETYISLCEEGFCGVCQAGFKNRNFEHSYSDIKRILVRGERLFIYPEVGVIALTLNDATGVAELIKSKNPTIK